MKKKIIERICDDCVALYDLPKTPYRFLKMFQDYFKEIPSNFSDSSFINLRLANEDVIKIEIGYERLETDLEYKNRLKLEEILENERKEIDIKLLKQLKEKYEGGHES